MCTCVTFTDANGNLYAGRNLDWGCGFGESPVITGAGYEWKALHTGEQKTKTAVIGMGIFPEGAPCPLYFDCANEDGLYVAGLSFAAGFADFTDPIEGKTNVTSYELPIWFASQFSTVDEAAEAAQNLNITGESALPGMDPSPLHWIIADKQRAIVIEQTKEGCKVYDNGLRVLTNQPDFPFHVNLQRNYIHLDTDWTEPETLGTTELTALGTGPSMMGLPGDQSSISRFIRAAILNGLYPVQDTDAANINRLFKELGSVAMFKGLCKMEDGNYEYTVYTGGYSTVSRTYTWNTYDDINTKSVCLDDYKGLQGVKVIAA